LANINWAVLFVDDNSPDGTYEEVLSVGETNNRVQGLLRLTDRGLSAACIEGIQKTESPFIAIMDADLQHDEAILPQLLKAVKDDGKDIAVGSRYHGDGSTGDWSLSRTLKSRLATLISRLVLPPDLKDPMSGFFLMRRKIFRAVENSLSGRGFKILMDIFASSSQKLDFVEIPYTFRLRQAGESKLTSRVAWEFLGFVFEKSARMRLIILSLLWGVVLMAALLPVILAQYPPGVDLPSHLARAFINYQLPYNEYFQQYYTFEWDILPNLGIDVVLWPLIRILPPYIAGNVFVGLTILLMFAGVAMLRRELYGRVGLMPLFATLFVYNFQILLGLANTYLGIGLVLVSVAVWMRANHWNWSSRLLVSSGLSVLLFFTHLIPLGFYAATIGLMRASEIYNERKFDWRKETVLVGQFVIPFILWLQVKAPTHGATTIFGPFRERLIAVSSPVFFGTTSASVLAGVLLALLVWLLIYRRIKVAPVMKWSIILLALICLILPVNLLGIGLFNSRLPLLVALLMVASVEIVIPEHRLRHALIAGLIIIAALGLNNANTVIAECNDRRAEFIDALEVIPSGARILSVTESKLDLQACPTIYNWHMAELAVIEKSVFLPLMFIQMQPLDVQPHLRHLIPKQPRPFSPEAFKGEYAPYGEPGWDEVIAERWKHDFDYLVWFHPGTTPKGVPDSVAPIIGTDSFTIFQIELN
jgi:glycosyltransferase involved in cell wall biosynthesis